MTSGDPLVRKSTGVLRLPKPWPKKLQFIGLFCLYKRHGVVSISLSTHSHGGMGTRMHSVGIRSAPTGLPETSLLNNLMLRQMYSLQHQTPSGYSDVIIRCGKLKMILFCISIISKLSNPTCGQYYIWHQPYLRGGSRLNSQWLLRFFCGAPKYKTGPLPAYLPTYLSICLPIYLFY